MSDHLDDDDLEGEIEILIEDDTPEADRGRQAAPDTEGDPDDQGHDESEAEYSERVRKRIAKETAKLHAERRAKEAAVRERDEAVALARQSLEQAKTLRRQAAQYEQGFVYQAKQAADAVIDKASRDYTEAMANGDTDSMIKAQRALIRAEQEKARYENYVPPQVEPDAPQQQAPASQVTPTAQVSQEELRRQTKFIQDNPWLNKDPEMTQRALQIDEHIRRNQPHLVGSDAYYEFVDTMMRQQFPADRFSTAQATGQQTQQDSQPRQAPRGAAPVNRGTGQKPRSVTLTETQMRLCKRLGITPQQYAAELLKKAN